MYHEKVCLSAPDRRAGLRSSGRLWRREEEIHEEYAYEPAELEDMLRGAGFRHIRQYGELKLRAPAPGEGRIFFAARKES